MTVLIMFSVNYIDNDGFFKEFSDFFRRQGSIFFNLRDVRRNTGCACMPGQF